MLKYRVSFWRVPVGDMLGDHQRISVQNMLKYSVSFWRVPDGDMLGDQKRISMQ